VIIRSSRTAPTWLCTEEVTQERSRTSVRCARTAAHRVASWRAIWKPTVGWAKIFSSVVSARCRSAWRRPLRSTWESASLAARNLVFLLHTGPLRPTCSSVCKFLPLGPCSRLLQRLLLDSGPPLVPLCMYKQVYPRCFHPTLWFSTGPPSLWTSHILHCRTFDHFPFNWQNQNKIWWKKSVLCQFLFKYLFLRLIFLKIKGSPLLRVVSILFYIICKKLKTKVYGFIFDLFLAFIFGSLSWICSWFFLLDLFLEGN